MTPSLGPVPTLALLAMSCCSTALAQAPVYPQTQTPTAPQRPYQANAAPPSQAPPRYAPQQQYPQQQYAAQPLAQRPGSEQPAAQPSQQPAYPRQAYGQQPQQQPYTPAPYPQSQQYGQQPSSQQSQPQAGQPPYTPLPQSTAQQAQGGYPSTAAQQAPAYRTAQQPTAPQAAPPRTPQTVAMNTSTTPEHPIVPTIRLAEAAKQRLEGIQDYSCTFVKREVIDGELTEHQYLFLKVRHQPFSVYIYFMGPAEVKGQEAIYFAGRNNGNIMAHTTGLKDTLVGTLSLRPDSAMAMQNNRHPITDIGLLNLTKKTIARSQGVLRFDDCDVKYFPGAKLNDRVCTCTQVTLSKQRGAETPFHMTRLFVDDELGFPIRFEAYGWPAKPGAQPPLIEEYTYLNLKFNNNFTDADFDHTNPAYKFR